MLEIFKKQISLSSIDQVNAADGPPNIQKETVSISDENKATFQIDDTAKKSVSIKTLGYLF